MHTSTKFKGRAQKNGALIMGVMTKTGDYKGVKTQRKADIQGVKYLVVVIVAVGSVVQAQRKKPNFSR